MSSAVNRVFVVEDEALIAMELGDRLASLGYAVCGVAAYGEEAIDQIPALAPDLVLMDINLAGALSGIDIARNLVGLTDAAVVFLTAYSDESLIRQAGTAGPFGYLVKPFEERELHATLQMALYKRQMEQALRESNARLEAQVREVNAIRNTLSDALESIEHGIALYDTEDRLVLFNRRIVARNPKSGDFVKVGVRFEDIRRMSVQQGMVALPPDTDPETFIAETVARHQRCDPAPLTIKYTDGRIMQFTTRRARNGGIITVGIDVTEQSAIEERLRQAQKMESIGKLTGGMAHDFNNHLGVIIGNLDLLRERDDLDADATELIDNALDVALRGAELTRSLLAFSRRQPLDPQLTQVNERIPRLANLLKRTLGEDIDIRTELGPGLRLVRIDGAQLDSCIINLANNARDAMPDGGVLTISTRNARLDELYARTNPGAEAGDYALVEVSDSGMGMSAETVAQAFDPFFTTKGVGQGTGLGLSMVYGFVRQSGGYIKIYSEIDHGTTVRIYLPRAVGLAEESPTAAETETNGSLPEGTETILVVEDNSQMRQTAVLQLKSLGYRTVEAENGAAALVVIDRFDQPLDLLFTDIVMPGVPDGSELSRIARERRPGLKVLLTSGFPGDTLQHKGKRPRKLHLLGKPYRKEELARTIRAVLEAEAPGPDDPE